MCALGLGREEVGREGGRGNGEGESGRKIGVSRRMQRKSKMMKGTDKERRLG